MTIHPDAAYEAYQRTRRLYEAMGFLYVLEEQFSDDPALAWFLKQL
jgi:hypothetical protein